MSAPWEDERYREILNRINPKAEIEKYDGGHSAYACTNIACIGCQFCEGGLFACVRCGGFEGSLPTDCPGVEMGSGQSDAVYAAKLDYRDGAWIEGAVSTIWASRVALARWREEQI